MLDQEAEVEGEEYKPGLSFYTYAQVQALDSLMHPARNCWQFREWLQWMPHNLIPWPPVVPAL